MSWSSLFTLICLVFTLYIFPLRSFKGDHYTCFSDAPQDWLILRVSFFLLFLSLLSSILSFVIPSFLSSIRSFFSFFSYLFFEYIEYMEFSRDTVLFGRALLLGTTSISWSLHYCTEHYVFSWERSQEKLQFSFILSKTHKVIRQKSLSGGRIWRYLRGCSRRKDNYR